MLLEKGRMIIVKNILGGILLIAGISLIIIPNIIVPVLCGATIIFGIILIIAGYFGIISGRRR